MHVHSAGSSTAALMYIGGHILHIPSRSCCCAKKAVKIVELLCFDYTYLRNYTHMHALVELLSALRRKLLPTS